MYGGMNFRNKDSTLNVTFKSFYNVLNSMKKKHLRLRVYIIFLRKKIINILVQTLL